MDSVDGFSILAAMPLDIITKRREWLENQLAVYKTLEIVKRLALQQPEGMVVAFPEPQTEISRDQRETSSGRKSMRDRILLHIKNNPGCTASETSKRMDISDASFYNHVKESDEIVKIGAKFYHESNVPEDYATHSDATAGDRSGIGSN